MKVIEPNPIIWGHKLGYPAWEIAAGLEISVERVRAEIEDYKQRREVAEHMLRSPDTPAQPNTANWKREVLGARAALAAIHYDRMALEERMGR